MSVVTAPHLSNSRANAENRSYVKLTTFLAPVAVSYHSTAAAVGGFWVYRIYATSGQPLYFGQSANIENRFRGHRSSRWFKERAGSVVIEEHDTREAARWAEVRRIRAERPLLNIHAKPTAASEASWAEWTEGILQEFGRPTVRRWHVAQAAKLRLLCSCRDCQHAADDRADDETPRQVAS